MAEKQPDKTGNNRDDKGRFIAGNSGNPNGRPGKGNSIAEILRTIGDGPSEIDPTKTKQQVMLFTVYEMAEKGEQWAVNFVADRTVGKPVQHNINENTELPAIEGFSAE